MGASRLTVYFVSTAAVLLVAAGGAAALLRGASAGEIISAEGACGKTPTMYRADSAYHHLPDGLIQQLTSHQPNAPHYREPVARCDTYQGSDGSRVDYCLCFGEVSCTHLSASERCKGEIGLVPPWGKVGVCRADSAEEFRDPCVIETITVG